MGEQPYEPAPDNLVRQHRREIDQILEALGQPRAFVTDESPFSDFPLRDEDAGPSLTEVRVELGVRVCRDDRLVEIARRLRRRRERLIRLATPTARQAWVEWLGERDAHALLLCLLQTIDRGTPIESLQKMVNGWRENALEALAADDYRASVDKYLEVSVDARLYVLARSELPEDDDEDAR
jgi:hypothetical protein